MQDRGMAEYWRKQARETRQIAYMISLNDARATLLKIAEEYDALAKLAEKQHSSYLPPKETTTSPTETD
jgi:hypothetical protein